MKRSSRLSHVDARGRVKMVDVGDKPVTSREAIARGMITMSRGVKKGIRCRPRGWPASSPPSRPRR